MCCDWCIKGVNSNYFLIQQDSLQVQLSRGQESRHAHSQPNEISVTSNCNEKMETNSESADSGAEFTETSSELPDCDPVDITVVNQCLREPVLCRDASETMVPSLLREVYESANPTDSMEALSVLLHVLMLETGYVTCVQVICDKHYSVLAHLYLAKLVYSVRIKISLGLTILKKINFSG